MLSLIVVGILYLTFCSREINYTYGGDSASSYTGFIWDVRVLLSSGGSLTKSHEYDAFGNEINKCATDTNPFRYCGEYYDAETGYIYLRARYYDPGTGSFITEDPIRDGVNWYGYCNGNPVGYVDPSGMEDVYIFYNKGDEENGSLKDRALDKQKEIESKSQSVYIKEITSATEFAEEWAKMDNNGNIIDSVYLFFHSNPNVLIMNEGAIATQARNNKNFFQLADLRVKSIDTIIMNSCNSAHLDHANTNLAFEFAKYQDVKKSLWLGWKYEMVGRW